MAGLQNENTTLIPSYVKVSTDLLIELLVLHILIEAELFIADATSIYTNIDTATGIQALQKHFQHL
jgi:hypothetical protein